MKRFKNILYLIETMDENEKATTRRVQSLARNNNAHVSLVRILEESFIEQLGKLISPQMKHLIDLAREQLLEDLEKVRTSSGWDGIETSTEILEGNDFLEIIQKVLRDDHDIVIKSATSNRGSDQLAMRLFRKCPCPVWVIRQTLGRSGFNVLAALDLGNSREDNRQLNRKIIELTHSLAEREGGTAHYLHAIHLEFEGMMRGPRFNIDDKTIDEMRQSLRLKCRKRLDTLFEDVGISPLDQNIHLINGETSSVINRSIGDLNIDILIMGTVARSGVPGLLIGNKAEKVLSQANCTVLAVKPDGFISPVK